MGTGREVPIRTSAIQKILVAGAAVSVLTAFGQQSPRIPVQPALAQFTRFLVSHRAQLAATTPAPAANGITVEYPRQHSLFPIDFAPPLFQWVDTNKEAKVWRIEVQFEESGPKIQEWSDGPMLHVGPVDKRLFGYVPPTLTPTQAASHTWRPSPATWEAIKTHSEKKPVVIRFEGFRSESDSQPVSEGQLTMQTSPQPVGAPIFFRDVPLIPPPPASERKGVIMPLPEGVLPLISWDLRYVSQEHSKIMMTGLPTCANCHSFSKDGKWMGLDVDGPQNDKGLYGIIPVHKTTVIDNKHVIHWASYSDQDSKKLFAFMSQISPDGKYVITSIDVPSNKGPRVVDRLYNGFYRNYGFGQVFFTTKGILAWYSVKDKKLLPLPGADNPKYVQTSAFWSPDGKYLIFSRALAENPYHPGQKPSTYANSPDETQIKYNLYRIPFNNGKGGKAEPVKGASFNGMSNDFPKVSPNGKWIVYVENKNGLLMRPDSKLYIVPFWGGKARELASNLARMNSWHTFSPNGHWLAWSSKTPSLYTELYITHIDRNGNATPAIQIENATASNRAVNIPEFINIKPGGLQKIEHPATKFYSQFDHAAELTSEHHYNAAIAAWKEAIAMDASDPREYNNMGIDLAALGKLNEAIAEYRKSLQMNPSNPMTEVNLGSALAQEGNLTEAQQHLENALRLNPANASAQIDLGNVLSEEGGNAQKAISLLLKGLAKKPDSSEGQNGLGIALAHAGNLADATTHLQEAVTLAPGDSGYHYNLGRVLAARGMFADALPQFQEAAQLTHMQDPAILQMLAGMYSETGQYDNAVKTAGTALDLARQQGNSSLAASLQANLERYRMQAQRTAPSGTGSTAN